MNRIWISDSRCLLKKKDPNLQDKISESLKRRSEDLEEKAKGFESSKEGFESPRRFLK